MLNRISQLYGHKAVMPDEKIDADHYDEDDPFVRCAVKLNEPFEHALYIRTASKMSYEILTEEEQEVSMRVDFEPVVSRLCLKMIALLSSNLDMVFLLELLIVCFIFGGADKLPFSILTILTVTGADNSSMQFILAFTEKCSRVFIISTTRTSKDSTRLSNVMSRSSKLALYTRIDLTGFAKCDIVTYIRKQLELRDDVTIDDNLLDRIYVSEWIAGFYFYLKFN